MPEPDLAVYLPILQRAFEVIGDVGLSDDRPAMLLAGHIGDALRHLPEQLARQGAFDEQQFWNDARDFGDRLPRPEAERWSYILGPGPDGAPGVVTAVAPADEIQRYLPLLWWFLVLLRNRWQTEESFSLLENVRITDSTGNAVTPTSLADVAWTQDDTDDAVLWGRAAGVLHRLAGYLVVYEGFDAAAFWADVVTPPADVSPALAIRWAQLFSQYTTR